MGAAHLDGVLSVATSRGYDYDFRVAGLLLVGSTLVFGGALCLSAVRGLVRGRRAAWGRAMSGGATVAVNGQRTPGKVAVFATCYVNYNEPGIGEDLLKLLEHNQIPYEIVEKEQCCGMP